MIKRLVLGFSVCFHSGMFSLTSFQLFVCISHSRSQQVRSYPGRCGWVSVFFFLNHQFWLKIPFPPTTCWFQSRIRSCFSYIQEFRCVKYIYTLVGLQCTRNVRSQPLPQGSLHQGCAFTFSLQLFVKLASGKRDVYSVKSSLPAIKLLSNATCRQETERRVEKKSALSIRHSLQEPAHLYQLLQTTLRDVPSDGRPTETPNSKVQLAVSLLISIVTVTWNTIIASIWWVSKFHQGDSSSGFIKPAWWQLEASSKHS